MKKLIFISLLLTLLTFNCLSSFTSTLGPASRAMIEADKDKRRRELENAEEKRKQEEHEALMQIMEEEYYQEEYYQYENKILEVFQSDKMYSDSSKINALKDLNGIFISYEKIPDKLENLGLKIDNIITDVELRLRISGIKILSENEMLHSGILVILSVQLDGFEVFENNFVFGISLDLYQECYLVRDIIREIYVPTWKKSLIGFSSGDNAKNFVRDHIKNCVDEFCNDYLKANPKKQNEK